MGKKRAAAAVSAVAAPVFPFPASAALPDHFSDYGFDPQLVHFFSQPEAKRPWGSRRHHQHQPAHSKPLDSTRFKLQKPISKAKHHQHLHRPQHQRRRRWWASAASAALLLFKRRCSSSGPAAAAPSPSPYGSGSAASVAPMPLYLADDDGPDACTCWAPAVRSGRLAAAELGAAAVSVPYVSLRSTSLGGGGTGVAGGGAPAMPPIYLVT